MTAKEEYELVTESGYPLDEATSALQKSIRRGMKKEALYWSLEIGYRFPDAIWRRLCIIAAEDIGAADLQTVTFIMATADRMVAQRKEMTHKVLDDVVLALAVLVMARAPKSREADDFLNQVVRERRLGKLVLDVPAYAVDKHTKRGKAMGKTAMDFWKEGPEGGRYLVNELYPSSYVGFDPEFGDASHNARGENVSTKLGGVPNIPGRPSQEPLF